LRFFPKAQRSYGTPWFEAQQRFARHYGSMTAIGKKLLNAGEPGQDIGVMRIAAKSRNNSC
jgi:hypothetical protein